MKSLPAVSPHASIVVATAVRRWLTPRIPGTVAAYLPMKDEVDVTSLFEQLPGWRWVLVRVEPDGEVTFRDRDVPSELHKFGMHQPTDSGEVVPTAHIDLYLVPGVAFDRTGGRLGRGRGFYDRILRTRRSDAVGLGVTTSERIMEKVPILDHDVKVDYLATEGGVEPAIR